MITFHTVGCDRVTQCSCPMPGSDKKRIRWVRWLPHSYIAPYLFCLAFSFLLFISAPYQIHHGYFRHSSQSTRCWTYLLTVGLLNAYHKITVCLLTVYHIDVEVHLFISQVKCAGLLIRPTPLTYFVGLLLHISDVRFMNESIVWFWALKNLNNSSEWFIHKSDWISDSLTGAKCLFVHLETLQCYIDLP